MTTACRYDWVRIGGIWKAETGIEGVDVICKAYKRDVQGVEEYVGNAFVVLRTRMFHGELACASEHLTLGRAKRAAVSDATRLAALLLEARGEES